MVPRLDFMLRVGAAVLVIVFAMVGNFMTNPLKHLPRNEAVPLFNPHVPTFVCKTEGEALPLFDSQADAWFREARTLEDASIYVDDRDYRSIVELTRKAAERRHWRAMLNLATFYLEGRVPQRSEEDAVQLVEGAMRLGVPAAYDRMGTYYMNGTGVPQDATKAYGFWWKAALMGSPQAQAYLGGKLNIGPNGNSSADWRNVPVATGLLECALGQGIGDVAYELHFIYAVPRKQDGWVISNGTAETKARALKVLHHGVKLGCSWCATDLSLEFQNPSSLAEMLVPSLDSARAARYEALGDALSFNPYRRLPNLDKILPLPPAELPPWDGTRESLLAAAMGVTFAASPAVADIKPLSGRYHLDPAYSLRKTGERTDAPRAPFAGYWQATVADRSVNLSGQVAHLHPGLYQKDEPFDALLVPAPGGAGRNAVPNVTWEYYRTIPRDPDAVAPQAVPVLVREVPPVNPPVRCASDQPCPVAGIWQPWVRDGHPLQSIVNQPWRQTWLAAGQAFPQPQRDWLLDLPAKDVTWHLMEASK